MNIKNKLPGVTAITGKQSRLGVQEVLTRISIFYVDYQFDIMLGKP
jgi:hypothetical protein